MTCRAAETSCKSASSPPPKHKLKGIWQIPSMPKGAKHPPLWAKWYRERPQKNGGWRQTSVWTCRVECHMDASHIVSWGHMISCCPVTPFLPGGPLSLLSSFSKCLLLCLFYSPFLPPHCFFSEMRKERGEGRLKKKQESISGKCIHLSIKSEQEAFWKRGRLESEDHLLWITGQISYRTDR